MTLDEAKRRLKQIEAEAAVRQAEATGATVIRVQYADYHEVLS